MPELQIISACVHSVIHTSKPEYYQRMFVDEHTTSVFGLARIEAKSQADSYLAQKIHSE